MPKKTPVEMNNAGFVTENHWDDHLLGRNQWLWDEHFGLRTLRISNEDGTISEFTVVNEVKVDFVKYLISRGINESVQNSYQAHAKGTGLGPRVEAFKRRVADLMAGRYERGKSRTEREVDVDDMTLKMVIFESLVTQYKITKKEAAALIKSVDVAAAQVAQRTGLDAEDILDDWKQSASDRLAELDEQLPGV
jgi:hypothetical protein